MISEVVPLVRFGGIVLLAVAVSFFTSMTLLPAILTLSSPSFLGYAETIQRSKNECVY